MTSQTPPQPGKKKRKWPVIVGAIVAVFVALVILGAIVGPQDESSSTAASSSANTPPAPSAASAPSAAPSTTATARPTSTTTAPAPTTTTAAAAAASARAGDPRCTPADDAIVGWIAAGLTDSSLKLTNATVIEDDGLLFVGATTVRPDGKFENRSDVWIVRDSLPFASTGGARSTTEWPKASDMLGISPGDERVAAVDACVVELTRS